MKNIFAYILGIGLLFVSCERDPDFALTNILVKHEKIVPNLTSFSVQCEFSTMILSSVYLQYADNPDFVGYEEVQMKKKEGKYSVDITNLYSATQYYIRYSLTTDIASNTTDSRMIKTLSSSNTTKEPTIGTENGYQYVDLGLSVKWATCNVGALDPSDYGDYYRFGETTPKNKYSGTYDGCSSYSFSVDAASVKWGGRWRMPTASQVEELTSKCNWTLITLDGVDGYNVKGKNGNSIFIPLAGYIHEANNHATGVGEYGFYWTSTSKTSGSTWHRLVFYKSGGIHTSCNVWGNPQYGSYAHPIRPVCP